MKILPYIVFCFLILSGVCTSMNSYHNTENRIAQDVNQALKQALSKMPGDMVTTDTIQCYRNYITIAELKDTAGIAIRTVRRDGHLETQLVAEANCSFATTFMMSDQNFMLSFHGWNTLVIGLFVVYEKKQAQNSRTRPVVWWHSAASGHIHDSFRRTDSSYSHAAFPAQDVHYF